MYCHNCRVEWDDYDEHCGYCGSELLPDSPYVISTDSDVLDDDSGQSYLPDSSSGYGTSQYLSAPLARRSTLNRPAAYPLSNGSSQKRVIVVHNHYYQGEPNYQGRQKSDSFVLGSYFGILVVLAAIVGFALLVFIMRLLIA